MDTKDLNKTQIQLYKKEVTPVVVRANQVAVTTIEESLKAQQLVVEIKRRQKALHEKFDPPCKQTRAAWEATKELYNFFINPFKEAEVIIKRKITDFQIVLDKEKEKEAEKLAAKQKKNGTELPPPVAPEPDKLSGTSFITKWRCEIESIDIKALCKHVVNGTLAPDVVIPNQSALNKLAETWEDKKQFKGLKFYPKMDMKARV